MELDEPQRPFRTAVIMFVFATVISTLIGVGGFGDPLQEVVPSAVGIGFGLSVTYYLYHHYIGDSDTTN
jgi:hypothetical protein